MKRQDLLTILITFGMGLFLGVYVYVAGFAPTSQRVSNAIEAVSDNIVITGEAYGGCDRIGNCPTFNIADDGTYRYLYTPLGAEQAVIREGSIPLTLQNQIKKYVTEAELGKQSVPIEPIFCESFVDGIDVRYEISFNTNDYTLNSCGTDVLAESPMWQALSNTWTYFERSS